MSKKYILGLTVLIAIGLVLPSQGFAAGDGDPVKTAPGPQAWVDAARGGTTLSIATAEGTLDLELSENDDLFAGDASVHGPDGQEVDTSQIHPLQGHVDGVPDSWVAVTADDDFVAGTIVAPGLGAFQVGPLEEGGFGVVAASELEPTGRTFEEPGWSVEQATPSDPVRSHATNQCLQAIPHHVANPAGRVLGYTPQRVYNLAVAVDQAFVNEYGSNWDAVATSYVNAADSFYEKTTNIRIQIDDLHSHSGAFTSTTTDGLLEEAKTHYDSSHSGMARDGVHVFTGTSTTNAIGQANCIGGAGDPVIAYTVSMGAHLDSFPILGFQFLTNAYVKVLAHEIGHIFSAHHHYANCAESVLVYNPIAPAEACTLMINFIDASTLSWSSVNELTVRGWADDAGV